MFHLAAFRATNQSTPIVQLNSIADQVTRQNGNGYIVPTIDGMNKLSMIYAGGANIARARLQSPSLIRHMFNGIECLLDAHATPASPMQVQDLTAQPFVLDAGEELDAYIGNANNSEYETIGVWFSNGNHVPAVYNSLSKSWISLKGKQPITLRATGTTTLTANAWTLATMTYSAIPPGRYAIVGMKAISTTNLLSRLVIPGYGWRPGVVGSTTESIVDYPQFRNNGLAAGGMGVFGIFDHLNPPNMECLATSADTAETLYLDCIKL